MGMRINTNVASINAQRNLSSSQEAANLSMAQLASGSRITKAADDAAGMALSENLRGEIRGLRVTQRNASDGVSMVQTAEGGLTEISNILVRLKELGVQASSDTVGDKERGFLNIEVQQLKDELNRIAKTTKFGNTHLLDGSGNDLELQIGTGNDAFKDRIVFHSGQNTATLDALGIDGIDYSTKDGARSMLDKIQEAQTKVIGTRANLGAIQNRLQSTINNAQISEENLSSANSRIRDVDVANATSELTKNNILTQAGAGVLVQANQSKMAALKLIG